MLIWDQTVAHGTAPNHSTNCRMAQYLKAFPRSKTFASPASRAAADADAAADAAIAQQVQGLHSDSIVTNPLREEHVGHVFTAATAAADACNNNISAGADVNARTAGSVISPLTNSNAPRPELSNRLLRRSDAVNKILKENNIRNIVTPLGETLFGLDLI